MKEVFDKRYTKPIKGIAIILIRWLPETYSFIDFSINEKAVSSIIAFAGDICLGMFAFVTGYGWNNSFYNKKVKTRIVQLY